MGSYLIPRDVRGEGRVLGFFSYKSFGFTLIGILVGVILSTPLKWLGLKLFGNIVLVLVALIFFAAGAFKVPPLNISPTFKIISEEYLNDVIQRGILFYFRGRKIYIYGKENKK